MDIVREIKDRVSMKELLDHYGIKPRRSTNNYTCLFHSPDEHPSAGITKDGKNFHCLAYETEIITREGIRKIGELNGKYVDILNGNGEWENVKIKSYGKQELLKITLCRGGNEYHKFTKDIYCTSGHRWFVKSCSKVGSKEKITTELKPKDRLICNSTKANDIEFDLDGIRHGFIYGDGFKHYKGDSTKATAVFYTKPKENLMKYFNNVEMKAHPSGKYFYQAEYKANRPLIDIPTFEDSDSYILGFLAGYFAADGSFGKGTCRVSCADLDKLNKIRDLCIHEKFMCKKIYSQYRLGIDKKYSWIHSFSVMASSLPKGFDLTKRFIPKDTTMNYIHWKVMGVEKTDRFEEVYCCETSTKSFTLMDNILTGNCFSCNCTASVIDVVSQIKECDLKKALRIIDNDFKLGLYRALSQKEKLELARESRERERLKREKLYWANFEKIVLARIAFQLRKEEQVRQICKDMKGKVNFDTRYDVYIDSEKRSAWLNWLYETICGYKDKKECEWDYTLGTEKMELLRAIQKGELTI